MAAISPGTRKVIAGRKRSKKCPAERFAIPVESSLSIQLAECGIDSGITRRRLSRDPYAFADFRPAADVAGWPYCRGGRLSAGAWLCQGISCDRAKPAGRAVTSY